MHGFATVDGAPRRMRGDRALVHRARAGLGRAGVDRWRAEQAALLRSPARMGQDARDGLQQLVGCKRQLNIALCRKFGPAQLLFKVFRPR